MSYQAPVKDMLFCMTELAGLEHLLTRVPGLRDSVVDGSAAVNDVAAQAF